MSSWVSCGSARMPGTLLDTGWVRQFLEVVPGRCIGTSRLVQMDPVTSGIKQFSMAPTCVRGCPRTAPRDPLRPLLARLIVAVYAPDAVPRR